MTSFKSYDSFEAMRADMSLMHEAAMDRLLPEQRELLPLRSFWWMRPAPEYDVVVFGHYDLDEWIANEQRLAAGDPDDPGVDVAHIEHNNLERGYKSGRAYSPIEPDGELGDTHVANMWPITEAAFEQAKAMRWDVIGKVSEISPLGQCFTAMFAAGKRSS